MRNRKNPRKDQASLLPGLKVTDIAKIIGVNKSTLYRRCKRGQFSFDVFPQVQTRNGVKFDTEGVFRLLFPSADDNTIALMMFDFLQTNKRVRRRKDGTNKESEDGNGR